MSDDYRWSDALRQAMQRNRRDAHSRYLQLATVRSDGTPAVRTLVAREFCPHTLQLRMVTDARSAKVEEIAANPAGQISWYFTRTREQFRLRGTLEAAGPDATDQDLRRSLWASLSEKAREQFFWPAPAQPLAQDLPSLPSVEGTPPPSFLLLTLTPQEIDHLCLRGAPQTRFLSTRDGQGDWTSVPVNP